MAVPLHCRFAGPLLALLTVLTWSTYSIASAAGAAPGLRPWDTTPLRFAGGAPRRPPPAPPPRPPLADLQHRLRGRRRPGPQPLGHDPAALRRRRPPGAPV